MEDINITGELAGRQLLSDRGPEATHVSGGHAPGQPYPDALG